MDTGHLLVITILLPLAGALLLGVLAPLGAQLRARRRAGDDAGDTGADLSARGAISGRRRGG